MENTDTLISADQVRAWCAAPGTHVTVRPVLDLEAHHATEAYAVPDRLAEQARLIHRGCVFPWCTQPARAHGTRAAGHPLTCDSDHGHDHRDGGRTSSCNISPLCRRRHHLDERRRLARLACTHPDEP